MRRRTFLFSLISVAILICSCSGTKNVQQVNTGFGVSKEGATVYFTSDISPKGLVEIYKALGVKPEGRVAVKISTGESSKSNHLRPELIADLVHEVNGTLVECNTAYGGSRATTEAHRKAIKERGFEAVAPVDIMDAEEDIQIPVKDKSHIQYDIVGSHIKNYDFVINLAHFKGHAMGGFGGVLKNQSIGFASSAGKLYISVYADISLYSQRIACKIKTARYLGVALYHGVFRQTSGKLYTVCLNRCLLNKKQTDNHANGH